MLNRLIDLGIAYRFFVLLMLLTLLFASFFILPSLKLDSFPDVTNVQVQINTEAPGLAATEVEQLITFPIEAVMYALPDVEQVRSISKAGLSVITVVFKDSIDIYFARQLVFERLQIAKENIPSGVGTPEMGPNSSGLGQIYQYILHTDSTNSLDGMDLRSLNDWVVKLLLMPVEGVTDVLSFGGEVKQFQVMVKPQQLLAYDLQLDEVIEAIEVNNHNAGGWFLDRGAEQLVIRGVGWVRSGHYGLSDIANIPLRTHQGVVIRVADVANIQFGSEIRQGAVTMSQREANGDIKTYGEVVAGIVLSRTGANTKSTIDAIKIRLPMIQQALPQGVFIKTFYDQSDLTEKAVSTVTQALLIAFILIVIILFLFLLNLRATLLVVISVPISIGLALIIMTQWGLSANLMSLGGLAIAIGMMVDGSVVMMEHIFRHLVQPDELHAGNFHRDRFDAKHDDHGVALRIQEAAREVGRPVFFAVMIIVIVFAPLFSLEGVEAKLFHPMAISIVLAMLISLLVALCVVPALATYSFKQGVAYRESPILRPLQTSYQYLLNQSLNNRKLVSIGAGSLFLLTLGLLPFLGTEFVPELEEGTLNIRVTLAPSSSLKTSINVAKKLEQQLMEFPEVIYTFSRIGRPELGGDPEPVSNIEIYVGLKPQSEWTSAGSRQVLQHLMHERLSLHPGLLFTFSQPIATRVDELLSGVKAQLAIKLFGPELTQLADYGKQIEALVRGIKGSRDVEMEPISGETQLVVRPNRDVLARYGISVAQVMDVVEKAIGGQSAGQVINGNERYDIYVRLDEEYRNSQSAIQALILKSPSGAWLRLSEVADVEIESGPPQIRRDDVQRRVVIQSNIEGRDMGGFVEEISQAISHEIQLPPGYSVEFGGQFKNQQRAQQRLLIVVPISLALIFLMLYFAFNSLGQAFLIMLNVPLALIGGVVALFISGQYLSVPGSIGFITLLGVAVLNGVVMVSAINQRIIDGASQQQAIVDAALSRLRPVLMTALTSALGLIPLLLATGVGSEIQRPLATVVIGGLSSSTLLTLIVLPSLYSVFTKTTNQDR
ncbi:MAG: CusA/CzcA family heavy metal efflux RND transporter [Gammaproteobacteria bacterium]|nr:CusA/CzcA family heavy metal efflux RND transporter [Gammaproteobacteria bacterium]